MGLWGKNDESLCAFPLSREEWSLIYEIALSQTVEGIVYDGILLLPNAYYPPYDLLLRWTARIDAIERYNKRVRGALAKLIEGFARNSISVVLLKGLGLAENYRKPLLRVSGDIDLLFENEAVYDRANSLLKSRGYKVNKGDHNSVFYSFNTIEVEHHTKMIDIFNPFKQKFISELIESEAGRSKKITVDGQEVTIPSYLMSHIQANAHILKHYMGFGIGLRQVCDIAMLCNAKDEGFNGDDLKSIYSKLDMDKWMNVMHNILVKNLGLNPSKLPYPIEKDCNISPILDDFMYSGNFGFHEVRFRENSASISRRYHKRDNIYKRVVPHWIKLLKLVPTEVMWYPLFKMYSKVTGK